jgi:hypothetical protein
VPQAGGAAVSIAKRVEKQFLAAKHVKPWKMWLEQVQR